MRCSCNEFQTTRIDESYPDRFLINVQKQQMYYRHGATNLRICWFYKLLNRFETDVLRIRTVSKILPYLCFLTFVDKAISQQFSECFWLYLWENCTFNIAGYSKLFQVDSSPNADDKFHPPKNFTSGCTFWADDQTCYTFISLSDITVLSILHQDVRYERKGTPQ